MTTAKQGKKRNRQQRRADAGKGPRIGLSDQQVIARKAWLRGHDGDGNKQPVCNDDGRPNTFASSEPWIDAAFPTLQDEKPDGQVITYRLHSRTGTPRDPIPTGFKRCCRCGHESPPQCVSARGVCLDCQVGATAGKQFQGSTSILSMKAVKRARRQGAEIIHAEI